MTTPDDGHRDPTGDPRDPGDPRPMLSRALDQTGALVTSTDFADGALPTPCSEYDVATLIAHLQAVVRRLGVVIAGEPFDSVPQIWESDDWADDWAAGRAATDAVLSDDANLDRLVITPWGEVPARAAAAVYIGELATHSWDLAVATGRREMLDDDVAAAALPPAAVQIPAEPRGGAIPFAPVVPVPEDAPPYERLAGWFGRDPAWV